MTDIIQEKQITMKTKYKEQILTVLNIIKKNKYKNRFKGHQIDTDAMGII